MTLKKNKICYFKAISKSIMVAQKRKRNIWLTFFAFMKAYYTKNQLIKALNSLDSSKPSGRLLDNPKTEDFRELFLPENDFKYCSRFSRSRFFRPENQPKT